MALPNYSAFAIPIYHLISLLPHAYAIQLIRRANNGRWNNSNPRSSDWHTLLQKSVPARVFARYERAEAAHKNCMENLSLFSAAVIMGNVARLEPSRLNGVTAAYLLARVAYMLVYVNVESKRWSFLRTGIYTVSVALCFALMIPAALALARESR